MSAPASRSALVSFFATLIAFLALFAGAGCSHYQLGTDNSSKLTFHTLYIEPVNSRTLVPQAKPLLSTQLRETFLRDGRVSLVDAPDGADAVLKVTVVEYHRDVATAREGDTGLARKFNLTFGAECTLHSNVEKRDLFSSRPVAVQREVFTDSGQLQSEYQLLPILAQTLSEKIAHTTLDVW